ncbi:hypothetical protein IEO21_00361 [Rhodonia placenta]|uniref:C2H2-type domain-containing protein n=1 Tax=Rhodonia placenta TaxID=104341 RepID=A0A8H7PC84_9APHY|nr:hypothetical protein IEO21_00361 [Postia placenta]
MTDHTYTSTVVLRKRKRQAEPLAILRVSSSPSPGYDLSQSESDYDPDTQHRPIAGPSKHQREVSTKRRPYQCPHPGCDKSYTKLSRLAEHERSHTGDRPFICSSCSKTYFRESHLQAHARSHLPDSAKPFVCGEPNCGKRFWTTQHLHVHEGTHKGEKPFQCSEPSCDASFAKQFQLRAHICTVHSPAGTKLYRCENSECTKSFATNQKLRAHLKTHDDKRYTCAHQSCLPAPGVPPTYFPTWTALQHHMRTTHPPACPYASCSGRTFTAQKGLRAHLKIHAERELEAELEDTVGESADEADDKPRKRRRGGEVGRDWVCEETGCGKDFKSKKALNTHLRVAHLGRRDFVCPQLSCGRTFGYKHLLQRHTAKAHPVDPPNSDGPDESDGSEGESSDADPDAQPAFSIDLITGNAYSARSQAQLITTKKLQCPYPNLPAMLAIEPAATHSTSSGSQVAKCSYVFSRAYDFRRHLLSEHGLKVEKERTDRWVRHVKEAKAIGGSDP